MENERCIMHSKSGHGATRRGLVVVAGRGCYGAIPGNLNLAWTNAELRPDRKMHEALVVHMVPNCSNVWRGHCIP